MFTREQGFFAYTTHSHEKIIKITVVHGHIGDNSTFVGAMNNEIVCEHSEEIIYYLTA
jgi:hypothetical protein